MLSSSLRGALARSTPKDVELTVRHLATSPAPCSALFSAPPGQPGEPTTCENHFLAVSIQPQAPEDGKVDNREELFIFAMEILVFTTTNLTTVFVSKADSTGYLYRLKLPPIAKPLMRSISTTFLSHVVSALQRPGIRLVLSLFARAQNQYLFPGSVENPGKHILDDRGLVKWWCRVVDPILRRHEPETKLDVNGHITEEEKNRDTEAKTTSATAYLIVPGCDKFESRTFFPPSAKLDPQAQPRWLNSYPLHQICGSQTAPPRCQVPRFPDDPKARFLLDLDDEVSDITNETSTGQWRSIKTIDQFWEMMAYRQECSSGRLVGFLWVVINPPGLLNSVPMVLSTSENAQTKPNIESTSINDATPKAEITSSLVLDSKRTGQNINSATQESQTQEQKETTVGSLPKTDVMAKNPPKNSTSPASVENYTDAIKLNGKDYHSLMNLLVELDFDNEKAAIDSTNSWVSKLSTIIGRNDHGEKLVGECEPQPVEKSTPQPAGASNLLSGGLIRKRKRDAGNTGTPSADDLDADRSSVAATLEGNNDGEQPSTSSSLPMTIPTINVLDASMIRKKKKREEF
ncbi:hypothetical protein ACJ73_08744 [Blastomyces percursus]|uniref:histone acetyltransferase n=1 Tax=Blastomyces percursus TaxID=1658174 RepID=A0A1J9PQD2_9EURO|nr:hypothetical protein ACJ73_08744 [Blastomyces percursus]